MTKNTDWTISDVFPHYAYKDLKSSTRTLLAKNVQNTLGCGYKDIL